MKPSEALAEIRSSLPEEARDKASTEFLYRLSLDAHGHYRGKMMTVPLVDQADHGWMEAWYTPGVSAVSRAIRDDAAVSFSHTCRGRTVAVVSDSTRVLGDGDVTPAGGMGVMEGKALIMRLLGGIDAVPICLDVKGDTDRLVDTVNAIAPSFGAINLEDIAQPRCYSVLRKLQESCSIPVWHDDAQGTACVVLAGLINSLKVTGRKIGETRIVLFGAGASNSTAARLMIHAGADPEKLILFNSKGGLHPGKLDSFQGEDWNWHRELCRTTNPERIDDIRKALNGADVLVAASRPGPDVIHPAWIRKMADGSIVFACANPVPEIYPSEAIDAGAAIVATGRGDYPNQVNNSLGFPGILKGVLLTGAVSITDSMAVAAARAIAEYAVRGVIGEGRILPSMTETGLYSFVASKVAAAAQAAGVARSYPSEEDVLEDAAASMEAGRKAWAAVTSSDVFEPYPESRVEKLKKEIIEEYQ